MAFKIRPFSLFKVQSVSLRAMGFWPGPERPALQRKHFVLTVLNCIFSTIVVVFQLNFALNSTDNISAMIESLLLSFTRMLVVIRMVVYMLKHNEFKEMLETFDLLVTDDPKSSSRIINNSMRKTELYYTSGFLFLAGATVVFYITVPIVKYLLSGENTWELPFMVKLPFDYQYFPMYQIVYVLITYSLFVLILVLAGIDGGLYGACLYIAGQFQIVEQKVITFLDLNEDEAKSVMTLKEKNEKIKEKLIEIVRHHNQCVELTKKVPHIYEFIIFTTFITFSIVMGLCSLNIIIAKGMEKLIFASYLLAAGIQMFGICKNGSTLTDSSARLATAAYNIEWYRCDKQIKYAVLTILMRSQMTTELQIPFCSVSMETFSRYMRSTGSIITLLKSFF